MNRTSLFLLIGGGAAIAWWAFTRAQQQARAPATHYAPADSHTPSANFGTIANPIAAIISALPTSRKQSVQSTQPAYNDMASALLTPQIDPGYSADYTPAADTTIPVDWSYANAGTYSA